VNRTPRDWLLLGAGRRGEKTFWTREGRWRAEAGVRCVGGAGEGGVITCVGGVGSFGCKSAPPAMERVRQARVAQLVIDKPTCGLHEVGCLVVCASCRPSPVWLASSVGIGGFQRRICADLRCALLGRKQVAAQPMAAWPRRSDDEAAVARRTHHDGHSSSLPASRVLPRSSCRSGSDQQARLETARSLPAWAAHPCCVVCASHFFSVWLQL
jgi:hypothetical protein